MKKSFFTLIILSVVSALSVAVVTDHGVSAQKTREIHVRTNVDDFARGRILVKFNSNINSSHAQQVIAALGARHDRELPGIGVHVVELPYQASERAFASAFNDRPEVEFAELDRKLPLQQTVPNDPFYPQWFLQKIQADAAWSTTTGSTNLVMAILDTGVDASHPDLSSKIIPGRNIYDNNNDTADVYGHGTAVAGIAGAASNNGIGVASIAWGCMIMPVRISDPSGMASTSDIASGLSWAADHGARVANISYYITGIKTVSSAAKYFQSKGGIVVASSGNYSTLETVQDDPYVVMVGATDPQDALYSYSNGGNNLDLVAPGNNTTTLSGGHYGTGGGTSFASPVVAGVAALVLSVNPSLTPAQVTDILKQTADDLGTNGWDVYYGSGRVNALKAVTAALASIGSVDTAAPSVVITSPTNGQRITGTSTNILVSATDNTRVVKNELYVDGVLVSTSSTAPFTIKWSTRKVVAGTHQLQCKVYDAAGNSGLSSELSVVK